MMVNAKGKVQRWNKGGERAREEWQYVCACAGVQVCQKSEEEEMEMGR